MNYDWKKIIDDQQKSELGVYKYCRENNIPVSSFYTNKKILTNKTTDDDIFFPVEVVEPVSNLISMNIDGHTVEFDSTLLNKIIGALK